MAAATMVKSLSLGIARLDSLHTSKAIGTTIGLSIESNKIIFEYFEKMDNANSTLESGIVIDSDLF